jgi:hypothetical protein
MVEMVAAAEVVAKGEMVGMVGMVGMALVASVLREVLGKEEMAEQQGVVALVAQVGAVVMEAKEAKEG